jgi:hypothetical protein
MDKSLPAFTCGARKLGLTGSSKSAQENYTVNQGFA